MALEGAKLTEGENTGLVSRLRALAPDIVTDNAPRIVAALKFIACTSMVFSKNRVFSVAGIGFLGAFGTIMAFGGKKTEEEKEKLRQEEPPPASDNPLADFTTKLFQPHKYPIEAGTGIAMLSSAIWTASSVFGKTGFSAGRLAGGALSFASDANIVFTKEQIGEPLSNPYQQGSLNYYVTELKNRPVMLSSLFNISSDIASLIGGAYEVRKGKEPNLLIAGGFLLAANTFQAMFVDKNDYNIEKKADAKVTEFKKPAVERKSNAWSDRAKTDMPQVVQM